MPFAEIHVDGRRALNGLALDWLGMDFRPRLIVLADLHVLWANAAAEQLLSSDCGLTLGGGSLHFESPIARRTFANYVEQIGPQFATLVVRCTDRPEHLLFRGWGVDSDHGPAACLEMTRDSANFLARYHDIERVFALTPAEHRIVIGLLNGRTAVQLGRDLTVSVDTVRTHVRRVYSKIGVRSREELFSRLRPYRMV